MNTTKRKKEPAATEEQRQSLEERGYIPLKQWYTEEAERRGVTVSAIRYKVLTKAVVIPERVTINSKVIYVLDRREAESA